MKSFYTAMFRCLERLHKNHATASMREALTEAVPEMRRRSDEVRKLTSMLLEGYSKDIRLAERYLREHGQNDFVDSETLGRYMGYFKAYENRVLLPLRRRVISAIKRL